MPPRSAPAKTTGDGAGFKGRFNAWRLGSTIFTRVSASPQRHRRSPVKVATSDIDHYHFALCASGHMRGDADGVDLHVRPGDMWFCDFTRPIETAYSQFDCCGLFIPRAALETRLGESLDLHGLQFSGGSASNRLLALFIAALKREVENLTASEAASMAEGLLDLIVGSVKAAAASAPRSCPEPSAANLLAVKRFIDQHLADRDLSVERVAGDCGLSRASLYRLFEPLGGVAKYIRQRRLARALTDITVTQRARAISEIAFDLGFSSESVFGRGFREAYGLSPREARAEALSGRRPLNVTRDGPMGRTLQTWLREL